jgi:hypothetical protein
MARTKPNTSTADAAVEAYIAVYAVEHDGERHEPGATLELSADDAKQLLEAGAIKPAAQPAAEPPAQPQKPA